MAIIYWSEESRPLTDREKDIVDSIRNNRHFIEFVDRTVSSLWSGCSFAEIRERARRSAIELSREGFFPWTPSTILLFVIADAFLESTLSLQENEWHIACGYLIGIFDQDDWYIDRGMFNPNNPVFKRLANHNFIRFASWAAYITDEGKQFLKIFWFIDEQNSLTIEGVFRFKEFAGHIGQS